MRKVKTAIQKLMGSLSGISTPVFGVSWNPPADERKVVVDLVDFLEDRRALYQDRCREDFDDVTRSLLEIRHELTRLIARCPENSEVKGSVKAMRGACRQYLDTAGRRQGAADPLPCGGFWIALGELRGKFGVHLAKLSAAYGVELPEHLATLTPGPDDDQQDDSHAK